MLYTTGDTEGAVQYFVGLLQEPTTRVYPASSGLGLVSDDGDGKPSSSERVYLEDFRVALKVCRIDIFPDTLLIRDNAALQTH